MDISHIAYAVSNLDRSMSELGSSLGLQWAPVQERRMHITVGDRDLETDIRFTYSVSGPPHLELIEGERGTIWEAAEGIHHVGGWVDDLTAAASEMPWPSEASGVSDSGRRPTGFSYHRDPSGTRIELVDGRSRPAFDRWFSGGPLA